MVFLNPAVLFGLIAAAIPVVLHFLNLQKLRRIQFSTLTFLKELQKTKIRKLKFKQWLLLFLRVLLILLLVSAFARPTLESLTISGTSAAKTSAVFIIDDSFSMSYVKGEGSQFNRAKEIVKDVLSRYQQGDEAVLLFVTRVNENDFSTNIQNVVNEADSKIISVTKESFHTAVDYASSLLNQSQNFNKELFILSDFSKQNLDSLNNRLDENAKLYLFNFTNGNFSNRAVNKFSLDNQLLEVDKTVSFSAEIKNNSNIAASNAVASLFINGKRSAQQSFDLEGNSHESISFETVLKEQGLIEASIELEQDEIQFDNTRYAAFYVPEKINILLVSEIEKDSRFIKLALMSASQNTTVEIKQISFHQLSSNLFSENDLTIFVGVDNSALNSAVEYVKNGGRILVLPGESTTADEFEQLLRSFNVSVNVNRVGNLNNNQSITYFGNVEYEHPIFKNLFENREETKIESPEIYSYLKIENDPRLKPIINLRDNSIFLTEYGLGEGKALIFTSAPVLEWNNFPIKSLFAPLINKAALYQTMETEMGQRVVAGDGIDIKTDNLKLPQIKIVKPDRTEEFVNIEDLETGNYFTYNNTNMLGVYEFYSGDNLVDYASVNFDAAESSNEFAEEEEIENYFSETVQNDNIVFINPDENYNEVIKQARFGTELWKYFLIAALIIAVVEMIVSKNSKKDLAEINK